MKTDRKDWRINTSAGQMASYETNGVEFDELAVRDIDLHIESMGGHVFDVHFGDVHLTVWRRGNVIHVRHNGGVIIGPSR